MQIVFRADASGMIGSGHVMRCLTLADALHAKGSEILFVCRAHEGHLGGLIEQRGHKAALLPEPAHPPTVSDYLSWLGADWQTDAEETITTMDRYGMSGPDWIIADHYAIDCRWEGTLRGHAARLMVIDDLAIRRHDCDLLLDQNLVRDFERRYDGLIPENALTLLGPRYALLAPEYAALHEKAKPRSGPVRRILVFFGGSDPCGLTRKTLSAFLTLARRDIDLDIVLGRMAPDRNEIETLAAGQKNIHLHGDLPSLAPLMAEADLAIGAGGATSWERLCLKLPALIVTVADNQVPVAQELDRLGLIRWLGPANAVDETLLLDALMSQTTAPPDSVFRTDTRLVDGRGAERIVQRMLAAASASWSTRRLD